MHSMRVAHRVRQWLQITPPGAAGSTVPILLMLGGINASVSVELARDGFVPYADDGEVELVYPVGVGNSWNAGDCCGEASTLHVDDVGFIAALAERLDPGRRRPLYLVGFSNGGRLAYEMACTDPSMFTRLAVVEAVPDDGCDVVAPISVLQVDGTKDEWVPYEPPETGYETPPATTEVALLRATDGCGAAEREARFGTLVLRLWDECDPGTGVEFATYVGLGHDWFPGDVSTPAAGTVIWDFLTGRPLNSVLAARAAS